MKIIEITLRNMAKKGKIAFKGSTAVVDANCYFRLLQDVFRGIFEKKVYYYLNPSHKYALLGGNIFLYELLTVAWCSVICL